MLLKATYLTRITVKLKYLQKPAHFFYTGKYFQNHCILMDFIKRNLDF